MNAGLCVVTSTFSLRRLAVSASVRTKSLARLGWRPLSNSSTTIRDESGTVSSAVTMASIRRVPSERSRASTSLPLLVSFRRRRQTRHHIAKRRFGESDLDERFLWNLSNNLRYALQRRSLFIASLAQRKQDRRKIGTVAQKLGGRLDARILAHRLGLRVEDIGAQIAPYSSDRSSQRKKLEAACPTVSDDFFITRKDGARDLTIRVPAPRKIIVPDHPSIPHRVCRIKKRPISYQCLSADN